MNLKQDSSAAWGNTPTFNHGSFGSTPTEILKRHQALLAEFNADRESFVWEKGWSQGGGQLETSRKTLATFVGTQADNLALTDNVTDSFNAVLHSLPLKEGDEILVNSHNYSLYFPLLEEWSKRRGFKVVKADVPYPPQNDDQIVESILAKVSDKTKLALVDHISSPTAIIFPVKRLVTELNKRGVDTFVDGAHAPGQIPLNIDDIGAAYYAGNNHKWLCAPASSGFLQVRKDKQDLILPAVGSYAATRDMPFAARFSYTGTRDRTPMALIPETIEYMASLNPKGWEGIFERNHALAVAAREVLCDKLGIEKPVPDSMIGTMFTLPIGILNFPDEIEKLGGTKRFRTAIMKRAGFGAYALPYPSEGSPYLLRVCAHLYNNIEQYHALADAVAKVVQEYGGKSPALAVSSAPKIDK